MTTQFQLDDIAVEVVHKRIKNIHLRVVPPLGRVRLAAPARVSLDTLRAFATSKLVWIRRQQQKIREQTRETIHEYRDGESHAVGGQRYVLSVIEQDRLPMIELRGEQMVLTLRAGASSATKAAMVDEWYRQQIKLAAPVLIAKWEPILGVQVRHFFVRQMKTRWGTCNTRKHTIRINTELAKMPLECLDYLVLHEMVHLLEPSHNARFKGLMDQFMPHWRTIRQQMNRLPLPHSA